MFFLTISLIDSFVSFAIKEVSVYNDKRYCFSHVLLPGITVLYLKSSWRHWGFEILKVEINESMWLYSGTASRAY